ncbi:MAG: ThuA domain-containing protein [Fibrobacteria bacterium]|nr:ThuA domain-containing protein [Fibrobacteria bacterium]
MIVLRLFISYCVLLTWLAGCSNNSDSAGVTVETTNGISGVVLDPEGVPAIGIEVTLRSSDYLLTTSLSAKTAASSVNIIDTTDSLGSYEFIVQETGSFLIQAYTDSITAVSIEVDKSDSIAINLGETKASLTGSLSGTVTYSSGDVGKLLVQVMGTDRYQILDSNVTAFSFLNMPAGWYTIRLTGLDPLRLEALSPKIEVESGKEATDIVIPVNEPLTGSISGIIWAPQTVRTGFGTNTDDFFLVSVEGTSISTVPDSLGNFNLRNVPVGTQTITARRTYSDKSITVNQNQVQVVKGGLTADINLVFKIDALIVDGIGRLDWQRTSSNVTAILESTGFFSVFTSTSPDTSGTLAEWNAWQPDFSSYDLVIVNYGVNGFRDTAAFPWPQAVRDSFELFVAGGGGTVILPSARETYGNWSAYDEIMGLTNGNADDFAGISIDSGGVVSEIPKGVGDSVFSANGSFTVSLIASAHPVTNGLSSVWLHTDDDFAAGLRGPMSGMTLLSYASDSSSTNRFPVNWVVSYNQGRVYNSTLGSIISEDDNTSMRCVGYQTMLIRGCEWAATGAVHYDIPIDFPSEISTKQNDILPVR